MSQQLTNLMLHSAPDSRHNCIIMLEKLQILPENKNKSVTITL